MTEIRETCVLAFRTSLDGRKTVRFNEPRQGLTVGNVRNASESLLNIPLFDPEVGVLVALTGAELVREESFPIL